MGKSIAVAGKGGTGKSTAAALIISYLVRNKMGPVLAIDADPDANLGTLLGVEPRTSIGELREEVLNEFKNFPAGQSKASYVESGLHQIIEEASGFDLITMGRGEGAGCYCFLNSLIRKFYDNLMPSYAWIVMDNEAGLEHLSRTTTADIDALLIVANDNPISWNTAKRICDITISLKSGIRSTHLLANMVPPERRAMLAERVNGYVIRSFIEFPENANLTEYSLAGRSLTGLEDPELDKRIKKIIDYVMGAQQFSF